MEVLSALLTKSASILNLHYFFLMPMQCAAAFSVPGLSRESLSLLNRVVPVSFPDAFSSRGHK